MAAKKDEDGEKKVVQVKATTGAWWKSTKTTEVAQAAEDAGEQAGEVARKRPRRSSAKTSLKKKAAQETEKKAAQETAEIPAVVTIEPVVVEKTAGEKEEGDRQNVPVSGKPARKRPPRNRKGSKNKGPKQLADADGEVTAELTVAAVPDIAPAPGDTPADEEKNLRERRKGKSSRGRRGKRGGKKTSPVDQANTREDEAPGDMTSDEPGFFRHHPERDLADFDNGEGDFSQEDDLPLEDGEEEEPFEFDEPQEEVKKVSKLLINAEEPEECRLALLEDGRLESIHVSTISRTQTKNNIYKARIVAIEPSLQAAFVDYGTEKNGFLPFSEIHPEYYKQELSNEVRHLVETHQWKRLTITDVLERGQEVLAQVVKEEVGKKGANMTTYLSIPGRCVVLMPGSDSSGISRKISGEEKRSQLRGAMASIDLPEGIGWIVRTASVDINEEALSRDVRYLLKLWEDIKHKGQEMQGVGLVYEDQESVLRFLREHFDPSIEEILVDDRTALEQVKKFIELLPEKQRNVKVRLHQGARPIFNQYSVEDQIESIYQPQVGLPSGGSIVISPTEALVAIDVNSGSTSKGKNFEASIFQANMEAATELARQLRLRDLGGLIVVDFIDMRNRKHIQAVEKKVREAMKKDKAKVDFSRISKFGLLQISRQKLGAPIEAGNYRQCEHCKGRGTVRSVETLSLYYLRRIQTGSSRKVVGRIECHFPIDVASYLQNNKRAELHDMEKRYGVEISIIAEPGMKPMDNELLFHKAEKEENPKKQA
jgi:ribonuclease E